MYIALILAVGLAPAVFSVLVGFYARRRVQQSIHISTDRVTSDRFNRFRTRYSPEAHFVEGMGFVVGDITCQLNALSPYVRCAANPFGPCEGCREYESKEFEPIA
ncbi:MAG: hypothetical protein DCF25_06760 [Leptolyngbya foveolarum]|uniref:Uncharacterized protein n=1 Tax=Leptolyngbya foveolarum TaxID=47253 RepID=A0A2W4UG79_9CYAN|nr:MAG: hypothetical protein DCF25_06760 [Leptolyngbya foveolarum]